MASFRILLCTVLTCASVSAQSSPPEVVAIAKRFDGEISLLEKAETAAIERIHEKYVEDLNEAERNASSPGKAADTAAILKELQAIAPGFAGAEMTPTLPAGLVKRRAEALVSVERVERDFSPRFQRVAAGYLNSLTQLEATLPKESPAHKPLSELKAKVAATGAAGSAHPLEDATFENTEWLWLGRADKVWTFLPKGRINVDRDSIGTFTWKITGPNTFVILANGKPYWEFKYFPSTMDAKGATIGNPADTLRMVFNRKSPQ